MISDSIIPSTLAREASSHLIVGQFEMARKMISNGLANFPIEIKFHYLSAQLAKADCNLPEAMRWLWSALALNSQSDLLRNEMQQLLMVLPAPLLDRPCVQTVDVWDTSAALQRRYELVKRCLAARFETSYRLTGLDAACGDGLGTRRLVERVGCRMIGLAESVDAVQRAESIHGTHRMVFGLAHLPWCLGEAVFDFGVGFRGLEHVDDPQALLIQWSRVCRGPLIVSVVNESVMPLRAYCDAFPNHRRHFTLQELESLLIMTGRRRITARYGQHVFEVRDGAVVGLLGGNENCPVPLDEYAQVLIVVADF